jgi:VCBS repeat-containing protein
MSDRPVLRIIRGDYPVRHLPIPKVSSYPKGTDMSTKNGSNSKNPLTPTTVKIATLTGAAKDDVFMLSEGTGNYELDVLANDPGSAKLYSLAQVSGLSKEQFPISTFVNLSGGLTQFAPTSDGSIARDGFSIGGGTVSIEDGKLIYANDNAQSMRGGETLTETFTYTIRMANGALSQATASFTIVGENDDATIDGDSDGLVKAGGESSEVTGQLKVSDIDHGEDRFADLADGALKGTYGSFDFDVMTGNWKYVLDNNSSRVQSLAEGEIVIEELVVTSFDGTATQTISVQIIGKDASQDGLGDASSAVPRYVVNHGQNFVNGIWLIEGFEDNAILHFAGTEYLGFKVLDANSDGILDTVISAYKENGSHAGHLEIILDGYSNFNPDTQVQVSGNNFVS